MSFSQNSSFYEKVIAKSKSVEDPDRQVGNFDPNNSPNLPLGIAKEINGTNYVICVDSSYFLPTGAYFSAYMALDFPKANKPIAFAAKDIKYNPEGVQGGEQAKLMLVSDHLIELGPNTALYLPGDGTNFVNWGCNGFESVNLHGRFIFSGEMLEPTNGDTAVTAEFQVNVTDLHNMLAEVTFSPFAVSGMEDFEFTVSQATVDMSDYVNPTGVPMPPCYHEIYPSDINLWRGFHIEYFEVKMPEKLSAHEEDTRIYAQHMFIDDAGVTGFVGASNLLSLGEGKTEGDWGFSVDSLQLGFTTNELTSGYMGGDIEVPMMDNNALEYEAAIAKNPQYRKPDYFFSVSTEESVNVSCFNSNLELYETSELSMTISNDKFRPNLELNGRWTLDKPKTKFEGIEFQSVNVVPESPYVSSGTFALVGAVEAKMGGFGISINHLGLGVQQGKVGISTEVALNIGDGNANQFSVESGFTVYSKIEKNEFTGKQEWNYDSFEINSVALDIQTSAIQLKGGIVFRKNDPIYGDGFAGDLEITIPDVIDPGIHLACTFGKLDYRYFSINARVPVQIPIVGGVVLTSFTGGVSYHMRDTRTPGDIIAAAETSNTANDTVVDLLPSYVPDAGMSIGLTAGVGFKYASEKLLNGEVVFSILFNSSGGLQSIMLAGEAYMMTKKSERANSNNYVKGTIAVGYDNANKVLDAQLQASAEFADAISASIWSQIYISPDLWYFYLGTPSNPCTVNVLNFATATSYFMFGQNLPPMPPPPPQVTSVVGGMQSGRDEQQIAGGNGIATGMNIQIGFNESIEWNNFAVYANAYLGTGFDMTLYKYANSTHCQGSSGEFGANYWYLNGQLYAYGGIGAGVAGKFMGSNFDFTVLSASMAMLLQGQLPNPTYVYGAVGLQATLFNTFNLDMNYDFDAGTECTIVN